MTRGDTNWLFRRANEPYGVRSFTERDDPAAVLRVQQMQGECYVRFGIADAAIVEPDGRLPSWLDHTRGENVIYCLAEARLPGASGAASARLVDGPLHSLPAYSLCTDGMHPSHQKSLLAMEQQGRRVREIGGLATTADADSVASFSIIREVIQHAIRGRRDDVLVMRLTPHSLRAFRATFGSIALQQVGKATVINAGGTPVVLTPAMAELLLVPDRVLAEIRLECGETRHRRMLEQSLSFLTDGLNEDELSEDVNEFLSSFNARVPTS